jgi:heat shock protein HslJ
MMRRPRLGAGLALIMASLSACATTAGAPLRGTTWALPSAGSAAPPSFKLDSSELRVTGFAGCNRFTGRFVLEGTQLSFSQVASTRRTCLNEDDIEPRFLKALDDVRGWRLEAGQLVLLAKDGKALLRLQAAPDKP